MRLNLTVGQDFIAHGHTIEFYGADGKVEKYYGLPGEYSTGKVFGDGDSHVALHHNDQGVASFLIFLKKPITFKVEICNSYSKTFRKTVVGRYLLKCLYITVVLFLVSIII